MRAQETQKLIDADIDHITTSVYDLVKAQDQSIQQQVDGNLAVALDKIDAKGGLGVDPDGTTVDVDGRQPAHAGDARRSRLPRINLGDEWVGMTTISRPTARLSTT